MTTSVAPLYLKAKGETAENMKAFFTRLQDARDAQSNLAGRFGASIYHSIIGGHPWAFEFPDNKAEVRLWRNLKDNLWIPRTKPAAFAMPGDAEIIRAINQEIAALPPIPDFMDHIIEFALPLRATWKNPNGDIGMALFDGNGVQWDAIKTVDDICIVTGPDLNSLRAALLELNPGASFLGYDHDDARFAASYDVIDEVELRKLVGAAANG